MLTEAEGIGRLLAKSTQIIPRRKLNQRKSCHAAHNNSKGQGRKRGTGKALKWEGDGEGGRLYGKVELRLKSKTL